MSEFKINTRLLSKSHINKLVNQILSEEVDGVKKYTLKEGVDWDVLTSSRKVELSSTQDSALTYKLMLGFNTIYIKVSKDFTRLFDSGTEKELNLANVDEVIKSSLREKFFVLNTGL